MWAFIYQYALAYFDLLDETAKCRVQTAKAIKIGDLFNCTMCCVWSLWYSLQPRDSSPVDIVTLAAQEIRRPLHRPREDKVQISRDREVLMRMAITFVAYGIRRPLHRPRENKVYHVTERF